MVSYARSTYAKSKQFHEKLKELQKTIRPASMRAYLFTKQGQNVDKASKKLNLREEEIAKIEALEAIRRSGIQAEMKYALAQAKQNGISLSEQIVSGQAIIPNLSKELLEKVPSLGVYNLFLFFTEEELEEYLQEKRK